MGFYYKCPVRSVGIENIVTKFEFRGRGSFPSILLLKKNMHKIIQIDREVMDITKFWDINPQMKYISPFSKLYESDESINKEDSSRVMYAIVFQCNQDEDENIYFSMDKDEQIKQLEENVLPKIYDRKLYEECLEAFPEICLTVLERELVVEKEALKRRKKLLNQEWTLDQTVIERDKSGRPYSVILKGTTSQLNALQKDSYKIIEGIETLIQKYLEEKAMLRGRGDQQIPIADREKMW